MFKDVNIKELLKLHEFSSYFIPGVIFMYGLNLLYANLGKFITENLSIGSVAIFFILSYGAGLVLQSVGNIIEKYFIDILFGNLKKKYEKKTQIDLKKLLKHAVKNEDNKIDLFKSQGKLRRGIATSFLALVLWGWFLRVLTPDNFYITFTLIIISIILFMYMRRAADREIEEIIKYGGE